jgi:hypothetical protein
MHLSALMVKKLTHQPLPRRDSSDVGSGGQRCDGRSPANGAAAMTTAIKAPTAWGRENQPRELTEVELSQGTGGGPSTSGADAGKVTLSPFSIMKTIDKASPLLF